jgi:FtsZ-interacting cell division protein YlmF
LIYLAIFDKILSNIASRDIMSQKIQTRVNRVKPSWGEIDSVILRLKRGESLIVDFSSLPVYLIQRAIDRISGAMSALDGFAKRLDSTTIYIFGGVNARPV